jgi:ribosomal protein L35AE/L33A
VENVDAVQRLRDKMQDALLEYERARGTSNPVHRVVKLLFILPMLMEEKLLAKEYWYNIKKGGKVPLHKLLSEMLDFICS